MAGLKVVAVKTLTDGNLDLEDLRAKAEKHKDNLAAFMAGHRLHLYTCLCSSSSDYLPIYVRCI